MATEWKVNSRDLSRFTEGDCHLFARALQKLTGWEIHTFDEEGTTCGSVHAWLMSPCGCWAVDVEGVRPSAAFLDDWRQWFPGETDTHAPRTWESLRDHWGGPAFGPYSVRRARVLAKRLFEHFFSMKKDGEAFIAQGLPSCACSGLPGGRPEAGWRGQELTSKNDRRQNPW